MQTRIHTPTPKLDLSIDFYKKLNFLDLGNNCFQAGNLLIEINPDRFARAGVKLIKKSWQSELTELKKLVHINENDNSYLLSDPSGVWIYLIEDDVAPFPENSQQSVLGNYSGITLESTDIARSALIWKTLGFTKEMGDISKGWVMLLNDDGEGLSIMKPFACPHLFFNPSLTFFNGKENNPKVIQEIRKLQIPISEEVTHFNPTGEVDNIIIRDPGGYGFFIFND